MTRRRTSWLVLVLLAACGPGDTEPVASDVHSSVTLLPPQGAVRTIDFTTDEGTAMSIDVAPDGSWLVFDLLGALYRLPITGGEATPLTANAGNSLNFHPAISRDGKSIAFISDRAGQNNVWVVDADGGNPRHVFADRWTRFMHPSWAPDGKSIVAVRVYPTPGRGWHRQYSEIWRLPLDGSEPVRLLGERLQHFDAPAYTTDGKQLYFHVSYSTGDGLGMLFAGHRIQRMDAETERVENVRSREPTTLSAGFIAALQRTGWAEDNPVDPPAAVVPVPSPDGARVAFALEQRGRSMTYRGHEYAPSTALVVRDLATGAERVVIDTATKDLTGVNAQYGYGVFPRFAWMPDGRSIVAMHQGKIRRTFLEGDSSVTIPFTARVHRVLSEMARSHITIDDSTVTSRFIQWPAGSPDGKRVAFVSMGRVWVSDLADGSPARLTTDSSGTVELTPSWSPDGQRIVFTTWSETGGGAVWISSSTPGGPATKLDLASARYLYPSFTRDGTALVLTRGPDHPSGWNALGGWKAIRTPVNGGSVLELADLPFGVPASIGMDGRVRFQDQAEAATAPGRLYYPVPPSARLDSLAIRVRSVALADESRQVKDELTFPARVYRGSEPVRSPGGTWVAFQSGRFLHVVPARDGDRINTDMNDTAVARTRIYDGGGIYHSWRDSSTLQFASGDRYVTYDARTRRIAEHPIRLSVPRVGGRGSVALVGARIIPVEGDRVIERGTIVIRGSRLACVDAAGSCDTTGVERVIDVSGKTIIPGLFDVHAHETEEPGGVIEPGRWESKVALAYGVTTILDPATRPESALPLGEMIEAGALAGPRTFSVSDFVIAPGIAWGDQQILTTQADADREIDRRARWGAVSVKNYRQAGRFQHQLLLQAARRNRISVTSEGGPLYFDVGVALDGQTGWEHLIASLPVYKDVAQFFGRAGTVYSPTSIVAGHVLGSMHWWRPRTEEWLDSTYRSLVPAPWLQAKLASTPRVPMKALSFPFIAEGVADIVRAGGRAALGEHGEQPGIGTHWELWSYATALTPMEALKVGTIDGAYFIGIDHETGSLAPGKLADLIVLDANPLVDIRNTAKIAFVMKSGAIYFDRRNGRGQSP